MSGERGVHVTTLLRLIGVELIGNVHAHEDVRRLALRKVVVDHPAL